MKNQMRFTIDFDETAEKKIPLNYHLQPLLNPHRSEIYDHLYRCIFIHHQVWN